MRNVIIESDSSIAVNLVNERAPENHPQRNFINDAKSLLTSTEATLNHIYREGNECADHLAKMGAEQDEILILIDGMPMSIREFIIRDSINLGQVLD